MEVKRRLFDEVTGKIMYEEKVLEMDIIPGLKKRSKIKFKGVGDETEFGKQDLHFIVEEASARPWDKSSILISSMRGTTIPQH